MLRLDDYILKDFLGKGTFGEVYLTQKVNNTERYYATKRMDRKMVDDPRYKKYFINEISILKKLYHDNIIRLQDFKQTNNHYYIIMEYCNGGSLSQCLKRYKEIYHRPFTEEIVQYIMRQIVSAVKYIHSQGIIHRDLKLDNILVNFFSQDDYDKINLLKAQIKIIDFGFASSKEENHLYTTAIGSPLNMDPLILKKFTAGKAQTNDLCYDEKADIWSLGALCYQMLIGNSPFDAYNMQELVEKIEIGTYKVPTNLSREVVSFLNGMLQYDPKKRLNSENLYNHAFLTKNVSEFTRINTNMVSKNVYGGQLNINIKNNQSIWAIFNEEAQKTFDNIPGNFFTGDQPLSESVYVAGTDNVQGITPLPYNEEQSFIDRNFQNTNSLPVIVDDQNPNSNSSLSTEVSGGLNIPPVPQVPPKNLSSIQFQNYPNQQNQFYPMQPNNNFQNINNNRQQQQQGHIITFRNEIFVEGKNLPINTGIYQNQQQNEQMYTNGMPFPGNNIIQDMRAMQSPNVKTKMPPQYQRMNSPPINNQINNNAPIIKRGINVIRVPAQRQNIPGNQQIKQNPYMNNPLIQQQYPQVKQTIQNQPIRQVINQPINNMMNQKQNDIKNVNQNNQLVIKQRQGNISPGPIIGQRKEYSKQTAPYNNQNTPNNNKFGNANNNNPKQNSRTPSKQVENALSNQKQIQKKIVFPKMQRDNPQRLPRVPSAQNLLNPNYKNFATNSPNKRMAINPQVNTPNRQIRNQYIPQQNQVRGVVRNLQFANSPKKQTVVQNTHFVRVPGNVF